MTRTLLSCPARAVVAFLLVFAVQVRAGEPGEPKSDESEDGGSEPGEPKDDEGEPGAPKDESGEAKSEAPKDNRAPAPAAEPAAVPPESKAEPTPAAEPAPAAESTPAPAAEPAAAPTGKKPRLLLLDVAPKGVPDTIAASLTDLLDLELERGGLYEVMSEEDFRSLMRAEEYKQLMGSNPMEQSEANLAKIAAGLDAPFLLRSSLGKVGSAYVLSLDLLDARQVKVVRRVNQTLVGDPTGLIGSVRTAVLALTLEEKGIARDISEELIDDLKIAEKKKTVFFSLSPVFELPIGPVRDANSVAYFYPYFYHLRLDAEIPVYSVLRFYASVSYGTTLGAELTMQDKHIGSVFEQYDDNGTTKWGTRDDLAKFMVAATQLKYSALRVPVHVGLKIVPETGRFLPFMVAGVGISYQKYSFGDESLSIQREPQEDGTCGGPYTQETIAWQGQQTPTCKFKTSSKSAGDIDTVGFDATLGAGLEWLLTHNIGLKVELRYTFTYAFKDERDLDAIFISEETDEYQVGTDTRKDLYADTFPVRKFHHGLGFSFGLVAYW